LKIVFLHCHVPKVDLVAKAPLALSTAVGQVPATVHDGMTMTTQSALLATAHHEAGHAVAAWTQNIALRKISIVKGPEFAGFVHHAPIMGSLRPDADRSSRIRFRAEKLIRVCLAGPAAQLRFNARSWRTYHGGEDHRKALGLIDYLSVNEVHANAYIRLLELEAVHIVPVHWDFIEALAKELITVSTMTGSAIAQFFQAEHNRR
jgi:ATP-dependent Zn protease